jgi:hypothetical protein
VNSFSCSLIHRFPPSVVKYQLGIQIMFDPFDQQQENKSGGSYDRRGPVKQQHLGEKIEMNPLQPPLPYTASIKTKQYPFDLPIIIPVFFHSLQNCVSFPHFFVRQL